MRADRRDFIRLTTAGAAGFLLVRSRPVLAAWPSSGKMAVNPNIDNMRVVACVDPAMLKGTPSAMTFAGQNAVVDSARVAANMDAMAMALANATTADAAWQAIFRSSKPWASTLVAIKINITESKNMARLAVVEKFCRMMAGFGVPAKNIIIYDWNTSFGGNMSSYTSSFSTTDATKIPGVLSNQNDALGGTTSAKLPDGSSVQCTKQIADGTVDILINIANNKGHTLFGGSTLCMKNHFGTLAPNHNNIATYVSNINKSDAILGGNPVRQQLCFIDSLFANKAQNSGTPEATPGYLIMGTFAPAVDYLTVKKVREAVMGATHDASIVNSFMTNFGYTTSDPVWVLVPPATSTNPDGGTDARTPAGTGGSGGGGSSTAGGGGSRGTGGAQAGGSPGSGGAQAGGSSGSGGAAAGGRGGTTGPGGSGGAGVAGSTGAGGASTGGRSTAASASGGDTGSGGSSSGGVLSAGGVGSGGTGSGGSNVAAGGSNGFATGGSSGSGGARKNGTSGGCGVGGGVPASGRWATLLALGAVAAGRQLRRLLVQRELLRRPDHAPDGTKGADIDETKE
jgi:hypothetical protein